MDKKRIYLDYAAATPIDKRVSEAMKKAEKLVWANASSLHKEGEMAKNILEESRTDIARILHCKKSEIIFTSGGTESANIAIQGIVMATKAKNVVPHIITSIIEHPAILEPIKELSRDGKIEVSYINPDEEGIINPESVAREVKENTVLVCVMHANNEIGTAQPIRKISGLIKNSNAKLLVDASQSAPYEDISIERLGADILLLDGIKMYGPRGAGILVAKHGVEVEPLLRGGGQEGGIRSGTENVVAAVGLAEALKICEKTREKESERIKQLRDYAIEEILQNIPNSSLNGSQELRLPNNINICFSHSAKASRDEAGIDSEFAVIKLDTMGFAVSAASACSNISSPTQGRGADRSVGLENSSYVIEAIGKKECAGSSLRFTLGRDTKKGDIDKLVAALKKVLK